METTTTSDYVLLKREAETVVISLNRPEKKNAINRAMYSDLVSALQDAEDDPTVRAIVLTGAGKTFTSGNDLVDFAVGDSSRSDSSVGDRSITEASGLEDNPVLAFLDTYRKFPKPVIVAVRGDAVGIGSTLLLHSDLCYASSDSHFSFPFVKLGLCPEFASSYLLPRIVGHAKAFEWLVQGRPFSAFEAHTFGLINAVVDDPLEYALTVANSLAQMPPQAVKEAKRLLKSVSLKQIDQSIGYEVQQFSRALQGAEFAEAVSAFFDKRSPKF